MISKDKAPPNTDKAAIGADKAAILRNTSFGSRLSAPALAELADAARVRAYAPGQLIQAEGDAAPALYAVADGRVRIYRVSARGREQVLHVLGPGEHFNHVAVFDGGPCAASADVLAAARLLVLPAESLRQVIQHYPEVGLAFLAEFAGRLRHLVNLIDELALQSVQSRLAALLVGQAERAARGEGVDAMTQAEMAAQLGTVREMIGRTLRNFKDQGLVAIDATGIVILNRAGLEALIEA